MSHERDQNSVASGQGCSLRTIKAFNHFDLFDDYLHLVWEGDLPEENVIVLVSFWRHDGGCGVGISCLIRDDGLSWFDEFDDRVIAWAELPEPYKEKT